MKRGNRKRKRGPDCLNCGQSLAPAMAYCPACGQENHDPRLPLGQVAADALGSLFNFDGKLWRTLRAMAVPGRLSSDYVSGKRIRYVPPFRLYLFISTAYFAINLLSLPEEELRRHLPADPSGGRRMAELRHLWPRADEAPDVLRRVELPIDSPWYGRLRAHVLRDPVGAADSLLAAHGRPGQAKAQARAAVVNALLRLPDSHRLEVPYSVRIRGFNMGFSRRDDEAFMRRTDVTQAEIDSSLATAGRRASWLERRSLLAMHRIDVGSAAGVARLIGQAQSAFSIALFLLVPLSALLAKLVFAWRRYYWEHLVHGLHLHAVLFLLMAAATVAGIPAGMVGGSAMFFAAVGGWFLYALFSALRFYGLGAGALLWRSTLFGLAYAPLVLTAMAVSLAWGLIGS